MWVQKFAITINFARTMSHNIFEVAIVWSKLCVHVTYNYINVSIGYFFPCAVTVTVAVVIFSDIGSQESKAFWQCCSLKLNQTPFSCDCPVIYYLRVGVLLLSWPDLHVRAELRHYQQVLPLIHLRTNLMA